MSEEVKRNPVGPVQVGGLIAPGQKVVGPDSVNPRLDRGELEDLLVRMRGSPGLTEAERRIAFEGFLVGASEDLKEVKDALAVARELQERSLKVAQALIDRFHGGVRES